MNRVSVIIPNFNRSGLVNQTVRNVLSQTLRPFEVIVVDDGSTDDSVASLRDEFGENIQIIEQENQGPGAARNAGLDVVTGDFVWLMDSDDLASLNKLETQVETLQQQSADIVYSPWARVFFDDPTLTLDGPVLQQRPVPSSRDVLTWFMTDWSLVFQHCLFRADAVARAGHYRTDIWTCDDSEYFVRVLTEDAKVAFDDRSLTLYRADDHQKVTGSGFQNSRRMIDWAKCLIAMQDTCEDRPDVAHHAEFDQRLWVAAEDLRRWCPEQSKLADELGDRIRRSRFDLAWRRLRSRIIKAIRTRVTQTGWSAAYQTGPITSHQRELVRELGFEIT